MDWSYVVQLQSINIWIGPGPVLVAVAPFRHKKMDLTGHENTSNICPHSMKAPASPTSPSQPSLSGTPSHTTPTAQSSCHSTPMPLPATTSQSKQNVASSSTPRMTHDHSPSLPPIKEALHDLLSAVLRLCQNLAAEKHRKCMEFPRLKTNRTWLQLIRSCTFLLDSSVPDF